MAGTIETTTNALSSTMILFQLELWDATLRASYFWDTALPRAFWSSAPCLALQIQFEQVAGGEVVVFQGMHYIC